MAALRGTVLAAKIVPSDSNDTYPTHVDSYGQGGYRCVATLSERNAISNDRRKPGMLVYVEEDDVVYKLGLDGSWLPLMASGAVNIGTTEQQSENVNILTVSFPLDGTSIRIPKQDNGITNSVNAYVVDADNNPVDVIVSQEGDDFVIQSPLPLTGLSLVVKHDTTSVITKTFALYGFAFTVPKTENDIKKSINTYVVDEQGEPVEMVVIDNPNSYTIRSNAEMDGLSLVVKHV